MAHPHRLRPLAVAAALAAATPALAQEEVAPQFGDEVPAPGSSTLSTQGGGPALIFTLLGGVKSEPEYFGSDETAARPAFGFRPTHLQVGRLGFGAPRVPADPNTRPLGFGVGGSFRYIRERDADEYDELAGLDDVDASVELGVNFGYAWPSFEAFAELRYGAVGHEDWVGELGANYVARPSDDFALRVGPRLLFGGDGYSDTYFGVSADEAAASGLDAYDPDGGLVSAGVEMIATYRLGDRWWLEGRAAYERLQDDAADSPIVDQGSRDQGTVSIGVRRAFVLEF